MAEVNEQSTAFLTITLLDEDGVQAAPTSARYMITVVDTKIEVRPWTDLANQALQEITLTPTDNSLFSKRAIEKHRVTVEGIYGANDAVRDEFVYEVKNLKDVV